MGKKIQLLFFLFLSLLGNLSYCMEQDSLEIVLKGLGNDTNKVNLLNELCTQNRSVNPAKALIFFEEGITLAKKLEFDQGLGNLFHNAGVIAHSGGEYPNALAMYEKALFHRNKVKDLKGLSNTQNNMAIVFRIQGEFDKALKYYHLAYKNAEEFGSYKEMASSTCNLSAVYYSLKNYNKCIEYSNKALLLLEGKDDARLIATAHNNLGLSIEALGDFDKAIEHYAIASKKFDEAGNRFGIATCINNIGVLYERQDRYEKALHQYKKALIIYDEVGNKEASSRAYFSIGSALSNLKKYAEGIASYERSIKMAKAIGAPDILSLAYKGLAEAYRAIGEHQLAYDNFLVYHKLQDSLFNLESNQQIAEMQERFESENKEKEINILQKDKEIQTANSKRQQLRFYFISSGLLVMLVFLLVLLNRFRLIRFQKGIIELQKKTVEEKNRDIVDSIEYARKIQATLLKEDQNLNEALPSHFVLFMPKDIVSGDFYWTHQKGDYCYVAVGDCTGHGVPGAFLTMLGIAFLNEINGTSVELSPADVLNRLREKFVKELKQKGEEHENKDGMDISIVKISQKRASTGDLNIEWAGANNPLWVIKEPQRAQSEEALPLLEYKADKQPIGFYPVYKPFTNHAITLSKGDKFYLFTDGYADQFGGDRQKKFMTSRFKNLLLESSCLGLEEQRQLLQTHFNEWRGNLEQLDDVCVIGVSV
jgi:tetratricopeptide (TPR) repeat protein